MGIRLLLDFLKSDSTTLIQSDLNPFSKGPKSGWNRWNMLNIIHIYAINVKSCKKVDENTQTAKFTVFPLWNQLRGAKNKKNNEISANLKRKLLKIFTYYTPSGGVPSESLRPKDSETVVLFGSSSFWSGVIGCRSRVKNQEKNWWKGGVKKKDTATIFVFRTWNLITPSETHIFRAWFNFRCESQKLWPCLFFNTS